MKRRHALWVVALVLLALLAWTIQLQGGWSALRAPSGPGSRLADSPELRRRGAYLARIGNCAACHTQRGGLSYAGGRAFTTPYGTVYSSNLTFQQGSGLAGWTREQFHHAMRHGVSRKGALAPVFPFVNFRLLNDADLDALFAHLRRLAPISAPTPPAQLDFPANLPGALYAWRLLELRPGAALPDPPDADPRLARGRYLVEGIGHCSMCHSAHGERGSLGGPQHLAGAHPVGLGWYAPPLDAHSLRRYSVQQLAQYLRGGSSVQGAAYGPMAEVIYAGLQYLTEDDAEAMARYLLALPPTRPVAETGNGSDALRFGPGRALYAEHCADCHGEDGNGDGERAPPLRGSVAVLAPDAGNAVRLVLNGGLPPSTTLNPRPYGMPPFAHRLTPAETAAVVSFIRAEWGGSQRKVQAHDVTRLGGMGEL